MRTDLKMKVFEWQRERLTLPGRLVFGTGFQRDAQGAMERAEDVAGALRGAIRAAYPREGKGNARALGTLVGYAEREFWAALRPAYFALLDALADLRPEADGAKERRDAALAAWADATRRVCRRAFADAVEGLDTDRYALERQARAGRRLEAGLFAAFDTPEAKALRAAARKAAEKAKKETARRGGRTNTREAMAL
jgi:hypothetical protein